MNKFSFKLEVFEGPLDLLMHLIQKSKLNIYDIPIAVITEQYLEFLESMQVMDLEISSEFLVMAANLLYIKSKMLLPKHNEEKEEEDPRQDLVDRLLEYKKYKEISKFLINRENKAKFIYYKNPENITPIIDTSNLLNMSISDLIKAFNKVLKKKNRKEPPSKLLFEGIVGREKVSVRVKAKEVLKLLLNGNKMKFIDIFNDLNSRAEVVACFLAVLELIKLNKIIIEMESGTEDIYISSWNDGEEDGDKRD